VLTVLLAAFSRLFPMNKKARSVPDRKGELTNDAVKPLIECPYDIFRKDERGHLSWCGAATDLPSAQAQIAKLAVHSPVEYFVSDHRMRTMVSTTPPYVTESDLASSNHA
jgi:hypothetical protein